mmetsp:Transcript_28941/g.47809  ORF Transcript_28941/g.47809 Transcript_28941/m.47809 type:complete len:144 (+) Transcript_28941:77-508(+)
MLSIKSLFVLLLTVASCTAFSIQPTSRTASSLQMGNFFEDIMKRFTVKADASHILIKGGAEAANKLEDLKASIGDSPVKFAEAAAEFSSCPSGRKGGNLGQFGPGQMVKEFDQIVFSEPVGVVHGPIKTQFGYHLIYINERND